ncbi:MAG TPA: thiamine pyrophosphate-dependent enzyme, partial [Acidimicrobiia bacterium]
GHSRADPGKYRPDQEVEEWKARDPLILFRKRLEALGVDPALLDDIDQQARAAVEQATTEARAGSPPGADALESQVWADGGSSWRR